MLEIVLKKNVFDVDDNVNVIQIKKNSWTFQHINLLKNNIDGRFGIDTIWALVFNMLEGSSGKQTLSQNVPFSSMITWLVLVCELNIRWTWEIYTESHVKQSKTCKLHFFQNIW